MSKKKLYEVTVSGQYYAMNDGQKSISHYKEKIVLDEKAKEMGFLSVIRREFLREVQGQYFYLRTKYPDWKRFRTHLIEEVVDLETKKPVRELRLMNRKQIISYINKKGLAVDPDLYEDVPSLQQALVDFRELGEEAFLIKQEKVRKQFGNHFAVAKSIRELNSKFYEAVPTSPSDTSLDSDEGIPLFDEQDELNSLLVGL